MPDHPTPIGPAPRRPPRFFLSHWRGNDQDIESLQRMLQFRGLHAWRDVHDLEIGRAFEEALRIAIREEVSAFIAYVTPDFLERDVIWRIEVPEALDRVRRDPDFLIIPLFCGVAPDELTKVCARHGLADLSAFNGHKIPPGAHRKARSAELRRVAQRTLRAGLRPRCTTDPTYIPRLLLRAKPHSAGEHGVDLDLDWTAPFATGCPTTDEWETELVPALHDVRDALSELSRRRLHVEVQARLSAPLAFGEVFSATAKYTLLFGGQNGAWSTEAARRKSPVLARHDLAAPGRDRNVALVEVSVARAVGHLVATHAAGLPDLPGRAVRLEPVGGPGLTAVVDDSWAVSAAWEVGEHLRAMHDDGVQHFHLYVAAPAEWCVLLGHTLNAIGTITVQQLHPATGEYVQSCTLGVRPPSRPLIARASP